MAPYDLTRRSLLAVGGAALAMSGWGRALAQSATAEPRSIFPVAETAYGRLRGINYGSISVFRGVPYGADTGGRRRFRPPEPPAPWAGVRDAYDFGPTAPQLPPDPRRAYVQMIEWDRQPGGMSEDCLRLNIWTPGPDNGRRPVFVSFHGGGFASGSGAGRGFHGDPLARYADAVVVTVNHRLNAFGHLHLAELGAPEELSRAGNAGMLDLIAALDWIAQNISAFGGDPDTVMIFGQSGGGAKTSAMMAMPAAQGLFHRAGVQSGARLVMNTAQDASRNAERLLDELGVGRDFDRLLNLPMERILEAQASLSGQTGLGFSPVVDGHDLPAHPFEPSAPQMSADIPMITSWTLDDASYQSDAFDMAERDIEPRLEDANVIDAANVLRAYRGAYPNLTPYLLFGRIMTDRNHRLRVEKQAERKAALGRAPAYVYRWDWSSRAFEGVFGAAHGMDVTMTFNNPGGVTGAFSDEAMVMADKLAAAWTAFARTGDPNCEALPAWDPYETPRRPTMVLNTSSQLRNDPDGDLQSFWRTS